MPITQIPLQDPPPPSHPRPDGGDMYEARHWESAYRDFNADNVPKLLIQLQDDLARSRRREAAWISIIVHLVLIILIWNEARIETLLGKWLPRRAVVVVSPGELSRQKELTYLELPPDQQKLTKRPNTNVISDKDRIATSRKAHLDPKDLKKILDSSRPGLPGPSTPPVASQPTQPPVAAQNPAPQAQQAPQQQQPPAPAPSADPNQVAKLQMPPLPKRAPKVTFGSSMSAESAVQQAARAALQNRGGGQVGEQGDYGLGQGNRGSQVLGPMEVLSDTMGVDFGPYLQRVLHDVREHWYNVIPEVARPPIMKKGKLAIEFAILKDGRVAGMKLTSSGDIALDRAAWGGITGSNPFPPLPPQFGGKYLSLRFRFYYNPDKS